MEYLHTMIRVTDLEASLAFFVGAMGMVELRRVRDRVPDRPALRRRRLRRDLRRGVRDLRHGRRRLLR